MKNASGTLCKSPFAKKIMVYQHLYSTYYWKNSYSNLNLQAIGNYNRNKINTIDDKPESSYTKIETISGR